MSAYTELFTGPSGRPMTMDERGAIYGTAHRRGVPRNQGSNEYIVAAFSAHIDEMKEREEFLADSQMIRESRQLREHYQRQVDAFKQATGLEDPQ